MRRVLQRLLWLAVALVFLAAGVNPALTWRLRGSLRHSLATPYVDLRLVGWPTAVVTGEYASVSVVAHRASVGRLAVDEFAVRLRGVRLDILRAVLLGRFVVRSADGGEATVRLLQEDVQRALVDRPYVENATLQLTNGRVRLAGAVTVAGAKVDVALAGVLVLQDSHQVVLHVETMTVRGVSLPPGVANVLIAPLNPLLSVYNLPVPLRLVGVEVRDGSAVITAEPR